ncbi:6-phosphogluconolactonase [Limimaricola pyoseonensis]|uniref:6-phosphogluconolactonase n=1 Tax=Limimaricola pyoseonensis TaxID=521013 RepID=A0A1G6ZW16_9RHOB|nr:6-phosphogluconolactonase [Limimaricola pyoseonensis]SDE06729.1 6-phosphogluconolactonase [Limimaricola pyoseonensis]
MEFVEYADAEMMMIDLADKLASELRAAIAADGRASLAVPGGTTPGPVFDTLSAISLDWDKVHVMLTDERWVPETSERSNTGLLKRRLFTGHAAAAHYLPLYAEAERPEEKLDDLEQSLAPHLPLSVVLLGMGADMHTASIFPGADRLEDALRGDGVLYPMRAPGAPEPRITLSAKVLNDAMRRHIVIIGAEKRAALEKAQGLDPEEAPVAAILKGATVHWAEG